jgi:hypothetical protein
VDEPSDRDVRVALTAALVVGTAVTVSSPVERPGLGCPVVVEDDAVLARRLIMGEVVRLRMLGAAAPAVLAAAATGGVDVDDQPVGRDAHRELGRWSREQVVSMTAHRYGHLLDPPPPIST